MQPYTSPNKNFDVLICRGCFWKVLGIIWRYLGEIVGKCSGTCLGGIWEAFERSVDCIKDYDQSLTYLRETYKTSYVTYTRHENNNVFVGGPIKHLRQSPVYRIPL